MERKKEENSADMKDRSKVFSGDDLLALIRRAQLYATGITYEETQKPFVAVVSTYNEMHPGHVHLKTLVERVKAGVRSAGGVPLEFGTIALCDALTEAHEGMNYVLPSRQVIADSVEVALRGHRYDAAVMVGSCDKIIPGLLMAAARVNIPAVIVTGGPAPQGYWARRKLTMTTKTLADIGAEYMGGKGGFDARIREEALASFFPCAGACWGMGTANTMACLSEALGMSLPGDSTAPAVMAEKQRLAEQAGERVIDLLKKRITPRAIMAKAGLENALKVNVAIGGSLNTVLHLPALARELGADLALEDFDRVSREVPHLANVEPNGPYPVIDFGKAGGIPAVMKRLEARLDRTAVTVTGRTVEENLRDVEVFDDEVIRPLERPVHPYGGFAVLRGNLAEGGAVVKQVGLPEHLWKFSGPACVFNAEDAAIDALLLGKIKKGDVAVIRYEGPKGGPGMREMSFFRAVMKMTALDYATYIVTDGRFSGYNEGPCIGYLSPEAAEGGAIALVQDGDIIEIDVEKRLLSLRVDGRELEDRKKRLVHPRKEVAQGYLELYRRLVGSSGGGAVIAAPGNDENGKE